MFMTLNGRKIRLWLNGRKREWLAVELDCSRETVDRLLAGKSTSAGMLLDLAKLMGCKAEDLVAPDVADHAVKRPA